MKLLLNFEIYILYFEKKIKGFEGEEILMESCSERDIGQ